MKFLHITDTDSINHLLAAINDDSLRTEVILDVAHMLYKEGDSIRFRKWNQKSFEVAQKNEDSINIGKAHFHLANFFYRNSLIDSSYYHYNKSYTIFSITGKEVFAVKMLTNMAILQSNVKDYVGSIVTSIQALELLPLNEHNELYKLYNNLGVASNELEAYGDAHRYHGIALETEEKINKPLLKSATLNNIGVVYQNQGYFLEAIKSYKMALSVDSLFVQDAELFAMIKDNMAYSQFKANIGKDTEFHFLRALEIRDSINHEPGIVINKIHLGEYYSSQGDTLAAISYTKEAMLLAEKTKNYRDLLRSYLLLSEIDTNGLKKNFESYIELNSSLQKEERRIQNKFAKIRFETDEFIFQNEQLNLQRRWMLFGFSGLILFLISIFLLRNQRIKNRELKLIQQQQKSNEDIYNLLIDSQTKVEEGQEKEKKRISRELHDGILSQFFGVRLNLELLNNKIDSASVEKRNNYIQELKLLENDIRKFSHQLNIDFLSSEKSFLKIIADLLKEQEIIGDFKSELCVKEEIIWEKVNPKIKINLYRIIQEAIHNINKYAVAKKVDVLFFETENELLLSVKDDGKGFDVENSTGGIGINNMKSRVNDLKGSISFKSDNNGTTIDIKIPL